MQADFSKGYGSVLDSGTTFTYLPTSAFKAFYAALQQAVQGTNLERAKNSDSVSMASQHTASSTC